MINAMGEGLSAAADSRRAEGALDRDWLVSAVESLLRQAFPTLVLVGADATIYFNEACRSLMLPLAAAQGTALPHLAPSLAAQLAPTLDAAWAGQAGQAQDVRVTVDRPEGMIELWVTTAITPVARDGKVSAIFCVFRDVTEEKRLRARLAAAEATVDSLTALAPMFLWRLDARGVVRWMNERCQAYLGVSLSQARDEGWIGWLHPQDRDRVISDWGRAVTLAQPTESRHRLRSAEGVYRWFTLRALPQFDETGALVEWHSAAIEADEGEDASTERRFLWTADAVTWTRRFLNADGRTNWPGDKGGALSWADQMALVVDEDRPSCRAALETLATGRPVRTAYRVRTAAGDLYAVEDTAFPVIEADGSVSGLMGESRVRNHAVTKVLLLDPARRGCSLVKALEATGLRVDAAQDMAYRPRERSEVGVVVYCSDSTVSDILRVAEVVIPAWPDHPLVVLGDPMASPSDIIALHRAGVVDVLSYDQTEEALVGAIRNHLINIHQNNDLEIPGRSTRERLARLSARERDILSRAVEGGTSKTIGRQLGISPRTVDYHRTKALDKLGLKSVSQASNLFTPVSALPVQRP
ncbi:PAS domain-containing protein [Brevundimonas sp. SORGH_AS_0993]|uniref:PAS domain-containing protein n=1 Tax=Brevundimonas sp. SORGH_AS_0993 TaxID=3041794 RepID=UPI00278311B7|nr:PAS domain-containing protein [Brevundimonas sp. SORGH_AS_0993]MDQ1154177.1 DNA-binding NarL/FixJ family response regulator/PAS domain-containing protein [Brevundimonas sp. SORGH_AS_0993]